MNEPTHLLDAWTVATEDISGCVSAALEIHDAGSASEIRALREEIRQLAQATSLMHEELLRLRMELARFSPTRISRAPAEPLVRLS
jgi:hypothetical protein